MKPLRVLVRNKGEIRGGSLHARARMEVTVKVRLSVLSCIALLLLTGGPSAAEDGVKMSLEECLRAALENNLSLVASRYTPSIREQDIRTQKSNFDVGLQSQLTYTESQNAATQLSTVTGSTRQSLDLAGIQQNLGFGANYTVNFNITKNEQTGPQVTAPISYFSGFNLDFNLPLMKGFGTEVTTEQLVLARNQYDISLADLKREAELLVEQVEGSYWDVVAAREALRIARLSLTRAKDLLELNRRKVEVGTLASIEITQAKAGVASQEENVIIAETDLLDAEDELRRLLAIPESDPLWEKSILNSSTPDYREVQVDHEQALATALDSRSELASFRQQLRNSELSERVARRQVRHQLDLNVNYGPAGASLDTPEIIDPMTMAVLFPAEKGELGESISNIFDGDVYSWSTQLTYRVPLGNRAAKANYARAQLSREQSDANLRDQEQTIHVEVRRAVRAVESGFKRVDAARVNTQLQREKLDAEQKKFQNGMSTSFEVLTFQNDLASAELAEVRARLDYQKSLAALERTKGTILEFHGLSLAD